MSEALRKATYTDLYALPEHVVGEIIAGELYVSPRPAAPHTNAASVMGADVNSRYHRRRGGPGGPGGWWSFFEPELHLDEDVLVPDMAGWRRERAPRGLHGAGFDLPPDWICEVVSPSTGRHDRARKMPIYARFGVQYSWLVDPLQRTLEVYRQHDGHWLLLVTHAGDITVRVEPFDEIEIELTRWWPEPDEDPAAGP